MYTVKVRRNPRAGSSPASHLGRVFLTRYSLELVPDQQTDHPGRRMLVTTRSRLPDGTALARPQLCVSPLLVINGDKRRASALAGRLDRRGYLPPKVPMTEKEWLSIVSQHSLAPFTAGVIWEICGRGVPMGIAIQRAAPDPLSSMRGLRRTINKTLAAIGWSGTSDDPEEDEARV